MSINTEDGPDLERSRSQALRFFDAEGHLTGRLISIFGDDSGGKMILHYLVDVPGAGYQDFEHLVTGPVHSISSLTPAASWHEREVHDRYGINFIGHPSLQPLLRHNGAGLPHGSTEEIEPREFLQVQGEGVCEVPVGPVHAGIIEPGHFRFSVVGDTVLHLQLRLFYTHKGTEKLFEGKMGTNAVPIAESVSGDNCFAHAVAYCQAVEGVSQAVIPPKANAIRLIGLEIERLLAHIGDFGALCGDVGFSIPAAYCARIKEDLLQASAKTIGARYWRSIAIPGGVRREITSADAQALTQSIRAAEADFSRIAEQALNTPSLEDRFEGAGILARARAEDLAVVGPVARACGIALDVRRDHPYGAYKNLSFEIPTWHYGDVMARARIRLMEINASVRLILDQLEALPEGPIQLAMPGPASGRAFAAVESPRGELVYWLQLQEGRITRCHVRSPSFQNWPALPFAVTGNIIADFPLINKSFNLSYSGCDR